MKSLPKIKVCEVTNFIVKMNIDKKVMIWLIFLSDINVYVRDVKISKYTYFKFWRD